MNLFNTYITDIGESAELFQEEKMVVLFGDNAPDGLAEYCYNIKLSTLQQDLKEGMIIKFDDYDYKITAIGDVVKKNLNDLGHITIKFSGDIEAEMAGTLYVEEKDLPNLKIGTKILICD